MSKRSYESMLFNYETSTRTDFRGGEIEPLTKTVYNEKSRCLRIRPPRLKDTHTLTDWKDPNIPFGLFTKPKDIIRTDPNNVQERYEEPPDLELDVVRKSRPRLVMTPAVSLDDADDNKRQVLLKDIYLSNTKKAMLDVMGRTAKSIVSPLGEKPAASNPLKFEKYHPPYVSPEWRMDSVQWDQRQLRAYCDPTREFWLSRPQKCR